MEIYRIIRGLKNQKNRLAKLGTSKIKASRVIQAVQSFICGILQEMIFHKNSVRDGVKKSGSEMERLKVS